MSKLLGPVIAALSLFAVLGLTACETSERADLSTSDLQARPRLVVRGPVVPDDPEPRASKSKTRTVVARAGAATPVSAPARAAAVGAAASAAAGATATPAEAPLVAPPVVETALPTSTSTSTGAEPRPSAPSTDYPAMIQAMIGGMPIWLMALIGVVLLAAIALGMSGGRKTGEA